MKENYTIPVAICLAKFNKSLAVTVSVHCAISVRKNGYQCNISKIELKTESYKFSFESIILIMI